MKTALKCVLVVMLLCSIGQGEEKPADIKLEPLFNGKDLTNFKVPDPNVWWKVADGVLVGESDGVSADQKKGNVAVNATQYKLLAHFISIFSHFFSLFHSYSTAFG